MSEWRSVCEMPEDFFGDVWVFSKHLKEPELAYTCLSNWGKYQGKRLFQEIHAVYDSDGTYREYFKDVSHYMEVVPPAPPATEANFNLIAAAPELYEACEQALVNDIAAEGESASNMFPALREKLVAALKKARGE